MKSSLDVENQEPYEGTESNVLNHQSEKQTRNPNIGEGINYLKKRNGKNGKKRNNKTLKTSSHQLDFEMK